MASGAHAPVPTISTLAGEDGNRRGGHPLPNAVQVQVSAQAGAPFAVAQDGARIADVECFAQPAAQRPPQVQTRPGISEHIAISQTALWDAIRSVIPTRSAIA